jgi:tetratricopeptide (TPR) repeat protein
MARIIPPGAAMEANQRGNDAREAGELDRAEDEYLAAIVIDAEYSSPWFNLGVLYKWQGRFDESRRCVERCLELQPDDNEGAIWNLGIATTALGDWPAARAAWKRYGIAIPDGDGPIEMNVGFTPIRLKVDPPEVVWCDRIDPARAIVRSVPSPPSGRRYGDLVLHDGEPAGTREYRGQEVDVFDELVLLEPSRYQTHVLEASAPTLGAYIELMEALEADHEGNELEDWSMSFRYLCKECSEGKPHGHGKPQGEPDDAEWKPDRQIAVATLDGARLPLVVRAWVASGDDRASGPVERVL